MIDSSALPDEEAENGKRQVSQRKLRTRWRFWRKNSPLIVN